jgi:hypothetical protein
VVYEQFALCSLGCGWLGRAALWLVFERWYVGTAVPEGGVGGLLGVVELGGCRSGGSEGSYCWVHRDLVCLDAGRRRRVAVLASSSLLERPVLAPPIALAAFSLRL